MENDIMTLPVKKMVLYKHGVGFVERGEKFTGNKPVKLSFKRDEMDDILKSLTIFDKGDGHVTGVSYETAEDVSKILAQKAITVPEGEALVGLFRQLRGYNVKIKTPGEEFEGVVMGTQEDSKIVEQLKEEKDTIVIRNQKGEIIPINADDIVNYQITIKEAIDDLDFFLDAF